MAEYLRVGISAERVNFHFEVNYCSFNIHYSFDHVPDHEQYVTAYDSVLPLQATNAGVRRPGYEATGVPPVTKQYCRASTPAHSPKWVSRLIMVQASCTMDSQWVQLVIILGVNDVLPRTSPSETHHNPWMVQMLYPLQSHGTTI